MEKKIFSGIYKITSPSCKIYIGQSEDLIRRSRVYKNSKENIKSQKRLYNSIKKHGWEKHTFEIIEYCEIEDLNCRERYWQDFYDVLGKNGLNCILQECGVQRRVYTQEYLEAMSLRVKGDKNPMFGYKFSQEQKDEMSIRRTGEGNSFFGKTHSAETLKQIRQTFEERGITYKDCDNPNAVEVIDTISLEIFCCVKYASSKNNVHMSTMIGYLNGTRKNMTSCVYLRDYIDGMIVLPQEREVKRSNKIIDLSTGIVYSSLRKAFRELKIHVPYQTLVAQLRKNIPNRVNLAYYAPEFHDHLVQK